MDEATRQRRRGLAFDLGPIAEIVVDAEGTLRQANERAREILGLQLDDVGRPFATLGASQRPVELREPIERAQRTGRGDLIRGVFVTTPDGHDRILDVQVIALATDHERLGTVVTFTEVTELLRLRGSLERSRHDVEAALTELRLTRAQLERMSQELQTSDAELKLTSEELRSSTEDLVVTTEELRSGSKELERTIGELDVRTTDLSATTRLMDSVIDSLGAAFVLDANLRVRLWSRECEELWGMHAGAVTGRELHEIQVGLPARQLEALVGTVLDGGEPAEVVVDTHDRGGLVVRCRVRASLLEGSDGGEGVLVVVRREPAVG